MWLGRITLGEAMRESLVRLEGAPAVMRGFPHWFAWSPMADAVRAAHTSPASVATAGVRRDEHQEAGNIDSLRDGLAVDITRFTRSSSLELVRTRASIDRPPVA